MSLHDKILQAKKRQQPYINLTNQKYLLSEILDSSNIESYQKIGLKSLYFRTDKLILSKEFADKIKKLVGIGIREVFIFCDQTLELNQESFNKFLTTFLRTPTLGCSASLIRRSSGQDRLLATAS